MRFRLRRWLITLSGFAAPVPFSSTRCFSYLPLNLTGFTFKINPMSKSFVTRASQVTAIIMFLLPVLHRDAVAQNVQIGKLNWNQKNLSVTSFRNGSVIPQVQDADDWIVAGLFREPAWCYYKTDDGKLDSSCGKLYNWWAVNDARGLAPKGYHIATREDWNALAKSIKGKGAGAKLRSAAGWKSGGGTNSSGFSAMAGGNRMYNNGRFFDLGASAYWWTATDAGYGKACSVGLMDGSDELTTDRDDNRTAGLSVRCVEGEPAVPLKNKMKNFRDSIIGTPARIGNLEVAHNDFPGSWSLTVATRACTKLGDGWRLPTKAEMDQIFAARRDIGGFGTEYYWYNDDKVKDSYGFLDFKDGETGYVDEKGTGRIRAVRNAQ